MNGTNFMRVEEVAEELNISKSYAYKIVQMLNAELKEKGILTISGRVNRKYFMERTCYGVNAILIVGHSDNEKVYHQHHVPCKIETTLYARRERYGSGDVTLLTNPGSICFR